MSRITDCHLFDLPKISDRRGNLTFLEENRHVPFDIKRVFFVYDLPTDENRGAHAHKECHEFVICLAGGVDVHIDDGFSRSTIHLNRPWRGLHLPPMIWASEGNFHPGTVYLVLASHEYEPADYIYDYSEYLNAIRGTGA
jgi:hypothetical protein